MINGNVFATTTYCFKTEGRPRSRQKPPPPLLTTKGYRFTAKGHRFTTKGDDKRSKVTVPVHDVVGGKREEQLVPHREREEHESPEENDLAEVGVEEAQRRDAPVHAVVLQQRVRVLLGFP